MTCDQQIDAFACLLRQYRAILESKTLKATGAGDAPKLDRLRTMYRLWSKNHNAMRLQYLLHNATVLEGFFSDLSTVFGDPDTAAK